MSDFRRLSPLILATGVNIVALGVTLPILQYFMLHLGGTPFQAALIFSIYSGCSFLSAPVWGRLSDHWGRKPILLMSIFCTILSYVWLAVATDLWEVFASRAFAGMTAGWLATSQAFVSDVTKPENRAKGLGLLGAAFGVGFVIGPAVGAISVGGADNPNYALPFFIAAGCTVAGLLITLLLVREPERHVSEIGSRAGTKVLSDPTTARLLGIYFSVFLIFTGVEGIFALWVKQSFDLGARDVGYYLAVAGVVAAIVQGGIVGRAVRRFGEAKVAVAGILFLALGTITLPMVEGASFIYLPMAFLAAGMSLHNPSMQSLLSRVAPPDWKGGVLGTAQSVSSLARIAGPAAAGAVFSQIGPNVPYFVGAVLLLPVAVFVISQMPRFRAAV